MSCGDEPPRPVVYQLVLRHWNSNSANKSDGTIEENGCGHFSNITPVILESLHQDLGVTHVWLCGALRNASLTDWSHVLGDDFAPDPVSVCKGRAGSFYAVKDYYDVSPDYADDPASRMEEFEALVKRVHDADMAVLLDFVPNHVSRVYHSTIKPELDFGRDDDQGLFFDTGNDFFYLPSDVSEGLVLPKAEHWSPVGFSFSPHLERESGTPGRTPKVTGDNCADRRPPVSSWYETVKLNYGYDFRACLGKYDPTPAVWKKMDAILAYWQEKGVDGFRCDFAHYVPKEAWSYLISRAKERHNRAFFLAEAYPYPGGDPITSRDQLVGGGFDAIYAHEPYNALKGIYQGHVDLAAHNDAVLALGEGGLAHAAMYLENHDERRVPSAIVHGVGPGDSGFGSAGANWQLAPVQLLCTSGPVIIYNGQELGEVGDEVSGFSQPNGRTSIFDYGSPPAIRRFLLGQSTTDELAVRDLYKALARVIGLQEAQHGEYFGLTFYNNPYAFEDCPQGLLTFARYTKGGGRILLVVANFKPSSGVAGQVRLPTELLRRANLDSSEILNAECLLDGGGDGDGEDHFSFYAEDGLPVSVRDQSASVFLITKAYISH